MTNKKPRRESTAGQEAGPGAGPDALERKTPKTKSFSGLQVKPDPYGPYLVTFFYPDYTVGSGVPPNPVLCFS